MRIFQGRRLSLHREDSRDNRWIEYVKKTDSCLVVAYDASSVLMVRVWRHIIGGSSLEFPGGGIDFGELSQAAAKRELQEETGLIAREIHKIGEFYPLPSVTNEVCHVFMAEFQSVRPAVPDNHEVSKIEFLSRDAFQNTIPLIYSGPDLIAFILAQNYLRTQ